MLIAVASRERERDLGVLIKLTTLIGKLFERSRVYHPQGSPHQAFGQKLLCKFGTVWRIPEGSKRKRDNISRETHFLYYDRAAIASHEQKGDTRTHLITNTNTPTCPHMHSVTSGEEGLAALACLAVALAHAVEGRVLHGEGRR